MAHPRVNTIGSRILFVKFVFVFVACMPTPTLAQTRSVSKNAVDTIQLRDKRQIRGIFLGVNADRQASIAVSSDWLNKFDKNLFAKTVQQSNQLATRARLQLRDRLKTWEPTRKFPSLDFMVSKELERIELEIEKPDPAPSQFLLLTLKSNSITSIQSASDANRSVALWSWYERLDDVETRQVSQLAEELKSKKVDSTLPPPDLSTRFPPVEEDDDHWTSRLALVSYRLAEPVEFQGSGEVMIQVGSNAPPSIATLIPQILQSQMNSLVQELAEGTSYSEKATLFERDWVKRSIAQAEVKGNNYFRATHLRFGSDGQSIFVDSIFLVRLASGQWSLSWKNSSDQSALSATPESMKRIMEDPQIKSLQGALKLLGGSEAFDKAIRVGSATMTAQTSVNDNFNSFVERYTRQLDSPPIEFPTR